jgi:predicted RNA-binding protein with RPS1 domain
LAVTDPNNEGRPIELPEGSVENQPTTTSSPEGAAQNGQASGPETEGQRRPFLIGSQRDPVAYRARQHRDWKPVVEKPKKAAKPAAERSEAGDSAAKPDSELKMRMPKSQLPPTMSAKPAANAVELASQVVAAVGIPQAPLPRPSVRDKLSPELEDELNQALGNASMDDLLGGGASADQESFEPDSVQTGRVVAIRRDDVFVEFNGREQGIVSLQLFDTPPEVGADIRVVVQRLNAEDGLYELSMPNKAVQVEDWSDLAEGMLVNTQVTGHNAGGLECEVNHIRGFIPVSQIALYRVEDLAQFVGQMFTCVITEANPDRRNLVLSRRAVLEREREETRQQMLNSLQPGQIRDGVVRKLMDFGAFVDLGGVDGLLHISQLAWGRVKHPSDVLHEGQQLKVRVDRVDPETGKISLAYRDLMDSPWATVEQKYPPNTVTRGTVTKLMDFGAFVELEPGIEGLVHISELSHKRVFRCSDVVKEGEQVEVMVRSIDTTAKRISLSMKELSAPPEPVKKEDEEPAEAAATKKKHQKPTGPLLGGIGKKTGDRFGLKW